MTPHKTPPPEESLRPCPDCGRSQDGISVHVCMVILDLKNEIERLEGENLRLKAEIELRKQEDDRLCGEVDASRSEIERLRAALENIASWNEGPIVNGSFDEPESAKIARSALAPKGGKS